MPWVTFNSVDEVKGNVSKRTGKSYDCYVLRGMKKGYPAGTPDTEYERVFFDNTVINVIEKGVARPGISLLSYLTHGCKPGDMLAIKSVRQRDGWVMSTIENITNESGQGKAGVEYTPLSAEEANMLAGQQMYAATDPTRPAAPATPQMAPLKYTPAV